MGVNKNSNDMIDFGASVRRFRELGMELQPERLHIHIPNAKEELVNGIRYYLRDDYKWLPEYDKVADWLTDNKGLGLFCMGNCGRGKTTICYQVLPVIINHYLGKIVERCLAREMNRDYKNIMGKQLLSIDDVGREEPYQEYGNRFNVFPEFVDDCERRGKFLIATTNLSIEELEEKYGRRTLSRLKATTLLVVFAGDDLRHG